MTNIYIDKYNIRYEINEEKKLIRKSSFENSQEKWRNWNHFYVCYLDELTKCLIIIWPKTNNMYKVTMTGPCIKG